MKYKTTISITTEAADKNEAIEIAGEYLSGNLASGVDMKYGARPAYQSKTVAIAAFIICMLITAGTTSFVTMTAVRNAGQSSCAYAIQPPLKTSCEYAKDGNQFKQEWKDAATKEALDYIKK